jgi:cation diffusion facilitator family transporter
MDAEARQRLAQKAAWVSLATTCVVVAVKLAGAGLSGSISVLAEALQSILDVAMSAVVVWAVKVAAKPSDDDHPFGHAKAELLATAFQMLLALMVACVIIWQAVPKLWAPSPISPDWGMAAMGYAVVSNMLVAAWLRQTAKKTGATSLSGESAHLISDTMASVGILAGLILYSFTKWAWIDPASAIFFTALGAISVVKHIFQVVHPLMDGALPQEEILKVEGILKTHPDVKGYHNLMTRTTGRERRVSLHVTMEDSMSFVRAHELAEEIEDEIIKALGGAWVTIHYEPHDAEMEHRRAHHPEPDDGAQP